MDSHGFKPITTPLVCDKCDNTVPVELPLDSTVTNANILAKAVASYGWGTYVKIGNMYVDMALHGSWSRLLCGTCMQELEDNKGFDNEESSK